MKKFEFEELSKVALSYGVILFGILLSLIGYALNGFIDTFVALIYVGILGILGFSFAKNEHFYSLIALLGLFVIAMFFGIGGTTVIGILTVIVFIVAVIVSINYYLFGNMKYVLMGLIGALVLLILITAIILFVTKDPWGNTNPISGIICLGLAFSLGGGLLAVFFMKSYVKKIDILKMYNVTFKKQKEVIELDEIHPMDEKADLNNKAE